MRCIILILSCHLTLMCYGQNFLSKYPNLTKKNLSEFFSDWKAYSDSVASLAIKNDSLIDMAVCENYLPCMLEGYRPAKEKYIVIPQYIKIESILSYREKNSNSWIKNAFILGIFSIFLVFGSFLWTDLDFPMALVG